MASAGTRSTSPPAANAVTIRPVAVLSYALGNRFKAFLAGVGVTSILQSSELQRNF
jgi:Na+/phosphate symporter